MDLAYGAADAWSAAVYGETNPNTVAFLRNQFNNVSNFVTDAGRRFFETSYNAFNHYNGSEALKFARKVVSTIQNAFETPHIVEYSTVKEFQGASVLMQRWVMANPTIREMYHQQRCDGYSNTYVDLYPGAVGEQHYDYRRAVDGLVTFGEDGGFKARIWMDDIREGDRPLILEEQIAISNSWAALEALAAIGKDDPVSAEGGML